jgi:hypothetical protein
MVQIPSLWSAAPLQQTSGVVLAMWHGLQTRSMVLSIAHHAMPVLSRQYLEIIRRLIFSQVLPHCRVFESVLAACAVLRQAGGIDSRDSVQYLRSKIQKYLRSTIQNGFFRLWEFR